MKLNVFELEMLIEACCEMAQQSTTVKESQADYLRLAARLDNKLKRQLENVKE
jgi:hypothetical protein